MVSGNVDTALAGFSFKLAFASERVGAAEGNLVIDFYESRSRIKENSPANVLRRGGLAPISIGEATANGRFILIHMYAIARMELFFRKSVLVTRSGFLLLGFVRTSFGLGSLTSET